jgi:hypothetical protein
MTVYATAAKWMTVGAGMMMEMMMMMMMGHAWQRGGSWCSSTGGWTRFREVGRWARRDHIVHFKVAECTLFPLLILIQLLGQGIPLGKDLLLVETKKEREG